MEGTTYGAMDIDHVAEGAELEPLRVGVVARNARGHDEAEGEGRETAYLAIAVCVLLEMIGLGFDLGHETGILDLEVFLLGLFGGVVKVGLEGVFELVDDLLQQFFVCGAMHALSLVSRNESEDGLGGLL